MAPATVEIDAANQGILRYKSGPAGPLRLICWPKKSAGKSTNSANKTLSTG